MNAKTVVLFLLLRGALMKKSLSKKQRIFCYYFVETGNPEKAFDIANMKNSVENIPKLMLDESIRSEIKRIYEYKKQNLSMKAEIGYERLAFGEIFDCIKLIFLKDIENYEIENMNFFNISEIKRLKDGTMEIKFFDRMKALEKVEQTESKKSENEILPFYSALEDGVKNLMKKEINED